MWNNANKNLLSETTKEDFKEKIRKFIKGEASSKDFIVNLQETKDMLEDDIEENKQPAENFDLFKKTFTELVDEVLGDSAEPYLKLDPTGWKKLTDRKKRKFNKRTIENEINENNEVNEDND